MVVVAVAAVAAVVVDYSEPAPGVVAAVAAETFQSDAMDAFDCLHCSQHPSALAHCQQNYSPSFQYSSQNSLKYLYLENERYIVAAISMGLFSCAGTHCR